MRKPRTMTLKRLRASTRHWVPYWRDRLGLRDWYIDMHYEAPLDKDVIADCSPNFPCRRARLRLTPEMTRWHGYTDAEVEEVLVHELLHIHLGGLGLGLGKYTASKVNKTALVEQVINALASCLVSRRRGRP